MKQIKFFTLILSLLLMASCTMGAAASYITASPARFGVLINNEFSDKGMYSPDDYIKIHYTIRSVDTGLYARAYLDPANLHYVIEEWVERIEASTTFAAGIDAEDPGRISIIGIPAGSYTIENIQVPDGSQLLQDPINLEFLTDYAEDGTAKHSGILNGSELPLATENGIDSLMLPFAVTFANGYMLPVPHYIDPVELVIRVIGTGLLILDGFYLISLVIKKKSEASQSEQS